MKKIIFALLAGIFLLNLSSCANENQEYSYSIKDALKISAYLFDENSGEDYFVYNKSGALDYNPEESVYTLEQLKMNEVRVMCPMDFNNIISLAIHFEFDGIIEVMRHLHNFGRALGR